MKRALIYLRPGHPTSFETVERQKLEEDGYDVRTRNARQFSGVPDPAELVVTDVDAIAKAYDSADCEVRGFKVKADDAPAGKEAPKSAAAKARAIAAEVQAEVNAAPGSDAGDASSKSSKSKK